MKRLKMGLIGYGRIAQLVHLNVLMNLPNVEFVALAESASEQRQEAYQQAPKAAIVADYQELLAMPEVEAVVICLPTHLHTEASIAAFKAGNVKLHHPTGIEGK